MEELNYINEKYEKPLKHSVLGIVSFIMGLFTGIMELVCVISSAVMVTSNPDSTAMGIVGLLILFGIILSLVGVGLGVAGVVQKKDKKVFSIIGLIMNSITVILVIGLLAIGLAMG